MSRPGQRRRACWWAAVPGGLFVSVTDPDQGRLAPGSTKNLQPGRQCPMGKSHWDGHSRKARRRRKSIAVVAVRRIEVANEPRRIIPRRIDQRVQLQLVGPALPRSRSPRSTPRARGSISPCGRGLSQSHTTPRVGSGWKPVTRTRSLPELTDRCAIGGSPQSQEYIIGVAYLCADKRDIE